MKITLAVLVALSYAVAVTSPALAADDSKVKTATDQLKSGANEIGGGKVGTGIWATAASPDGMSTWPLDVPACTKKRFGHVGPGTDACQWLQTTNSCTSVRQTGRAWSAKHCRIGCPSAGSSAPPFANLCA